MIITISGRSGSGKTTIVNHLLKHFGKERICYLHQDSYYKDQGHIPYEERARINFDHPETLELELFAKHLQMLASGKSIKKPKYDYTTHTRLKSYDIIEPKEIIVADGIFALYLEQIRKLSDISVFVDADLDLCFIRRLMRDTKERGRSIESVINQYVDTVKPMQDKYVAPTVEYADFIIKDGGHNLEAVNNLIKLIKNKIL